MLPHLGLGDFGAKHLFGDGVHQQSGRGIGITRVFFNQGAGGQNGGFVDLLHGHAVIQIAHGFCDDGFGFDILPQTLASGTNDFRHALLVQSHALPVLGHMQRGRGRFGLLFLGQSLAGATFAVQHIGPGHLVMAAAHQSQFNLVLHILDVEGSAARPRSHQGAHHGLG